MRFRLKKLVFSAVGSRQIEHLDRGPTWLDDELQVSYLRGEITFTRTNESILVEGTIETATTVQCCRSLELFELPLSAAFEDVAFSLPGFPAVEPDRGIHEDGWIDLTETVREIVIMAIPMNPVSPRYTHREGLETLADLDLDEEVLKDDRDSHWLNVNWASRE